MASGYLRERNGRFYVRTCLRMVDPQTGQWRWKHIERAAGTDKRKALEMLRVVREETRDGRYVPCAMTVLQLGNMWLREHVEPNLKPGAVANYRGTFYRHIAPELGMLRVDDCTAQRVVGLLLKKRAEGMSETGVGKIRRHVHAMFAFAQDAGLVAVNPADMARARGRRRANARARGTELSQAQVGAFLEECSQQWRPFFIVALDTGLRRGELIGLRWGDVDLLERTINVRRSIGPYDQRDRERGEHLSTKTEAGERLVPILDGAQAALEELYASALDTRESAPVFATVERRRGADRVLSHVAQPLSPRMVSRMFRRFADNAGLPRTVRMHDLRHTAITNAIGQGEDILLVSAFAGHANTSTTVDVYGHLMPERVRAAAARMRSVSGVIPE